MNIDYREIWETEIYDAETAQIVAKGLVSKFGMHQAISLTEDMLELSLITYNDNLDQEGAKSFIDKSCRVLDILRPIDTGGWYSHCKDQKMLADYLTIDYDCISDAINLLNQLSKQSMMRAAGLAIVMTDPSMKIMAEKFYDLNNMYEKAIGTLTKMQKHIAETSHKERKFEDSGDILSSKMYSIDGKVCGYIYNGKIYLNSDMGNHKAPIHLYTYIWMKHCKNSNNRLYNAIIDLASATAYFHHIRCSKRFAELDREEMAIKAICYMTAFDAADIFFDENQKAQLMSSNLATYQTLPLPQMLDFVIGLTIDEAKRLPLISFIRGDKVLDRDICE